MYLPLLVLSGVFAAKTILAYADPGSGMLIWQLATAAVLGLLFYTKVVFRKIRRLGLGPILRKRQNQLSSDSKN
ncbi:MAG: hypothetical protein C5B55_14225 [Blastocatellia bacterium]|nr:MAG: hypothetical protein C5B55_14225 [Blastocatellia bacterium]